MPSNRTLNWFNEHSGSPQHPPAVLSAGSDPRSAAATGRVVFSLNSDGAGGWGRGEGGPLAGLLEGTLKEACPCVQFPECTGEKPCSGPHLSPTKASSLPLRPLDLRPGRGLCVSVRRATADHGAGGAVRLGQHVRNSGAPVSRS